VSENQDTQLAVVEPQRLASWTPRFALTVDEAVALVDKKREFMKRVMREGEHFGTIPGTPKPTLYKPGAELLLSAMGLHSDSSINTVPPIIDMLGKDHGGEPFIQFQKTCDVYREEIAGERILIARASANCSSWEKKYRYRKADRTCPQCGKVGTIIKGKAEYGGGWLCWKNKGGCGTKFTDIDKRITDQATADIPNPDIADLINTIEKIASKRALVAATLLATGCSDIFTQDLEDGQGSTEDDRAPAVDQDGVIANPSAASTDALKTAQGGGSAPSSSGSVPTTAEKVSGGSQRPTGPRAKRGANVVTAPQGESPKGKADTVPAAAAASALGSPERAPDSLGGRNTSTAPPVTLDEPLDGQAEYLESLREQARQVAAEVVHLRVLLTNQKNKEAIALGTAQPLALTPLTPHAGSEESLRAFVQNTYNKTLDELTEAELDGTEAKPGVIRTLQGIVDRLNKQGVKVD